jgi:hypothetical protein
LCEKRFGKSVKKKLVVVYSKALLKHLTGGDDGNEGDLESV